MDVVFLPAVIIGGLGCLFGLILAFATKVFFVKIDERVEKINEILPGANCGGCGYAGCSNYADAIIKNGVDFTLCTPGGMEAISQIAALLGKTAVHREKQIAFIHCASGGYHNTKRKFDYQGVPSCRAVVLLSTGPNVCSEGCVFQNDCIEACRFGAISLNEEGMRIIDPLKCMGCSTCARVCPRKLIEIVPANKNVHVRCSSTKRGLSAKRNCGADTACVGCGLCQKSCPVEAIKVEDHLAKINYTICINCGICAKKCPTKAIIDTKEKRGKANIIKDECVGCTICAKKCPVGCISGELKKPYDIDQDKCVGCEICVDNCPQKAIIIEY